MRAATTATSWARWTPRLPSSGYYNVYMRWTSASNRASAAMVHINTPRRSNTHATSTSDSTGERWYSLGRYYFSAGYTTGAGSVSLFATGADGYVVADAVMFVKTQ